MADYTFAITGSDLSGPAWKAFVDNVRKANEQVEALGKTPGMDKMASGITDIKARIEGLVGAAKGVVGTLSSLWVVEQVRQYGASAEATAVQIAGLARQTGLTTGQVQALQTMSRATGQSFDDLAKYAQENAGWLAKVTEQAERLGTTMADGPIKQAEVLAEKSTVAQKKLEAMVAGPWVSGKWWVTERLENLIANLDVINAHSGLMKIAELVRLLDPTRSTGPQFRTESLDRAIEEKQSNIDAIDRQFKNPLTPQQREVYTRNREQEQQDLNQLLARRGQALGPSPEAPFVAPQDALRQMKPVIVTDTKPTGGGGGGGGRTDDDMLEAQIKRYEALGVAATKALGAIESQRGKSIEDMTREVNVQRQIDEIVGKLGAKYDQATEAQKKRLYAAVSGAELERSNVEKLMQAHTRADATERQYGDGQLVLRDGTKQLTEAFETGRLSIEARNNAMKILGQTTEDLRLKNLGLQGGLVGFAAGFEDAQNRFERANNAFALGGRTFDLVMNTMDQGLTQFVKNGKIELADFVGNFLLSIAQMEARVAMSSLWNAAGGASGILGGLFGLFGGGSNPSFPGLTPGTMNMGGGFSGLTPGVMTMSAGGGPIGAGEMQLVGEKGIELFTPNTGGNILNRQQLQALGVGEGGGNVVNVSLGGVTIGEFVSPSQHRRDLMQVQKAAEAGAIAALMKMQRSGDRRMRVSGFG